MQLEHVSIECPIPMNNWKWIHFLRGSMLRESSCYRDQEAWACFDVNSRLSFSTIFLLSAVSSTGIQRVWSHTTVILPIFDIHHLPSAHTFVENVRKLEQRTRRCSSVRDLVHVGKHVPPTCEDKASFVSIFCFFKSIETPIDQASFLETVNQVCIR